MKPQVLTRTTSASSASAVRAQPAASRRPASSSESTSLRAQPKVTSATLREGDGTTCRLPAPGPGPPGRSRTVLDTVRGVSVVVRRARTGDVPAIKSIVDIYAGSGRRLLAKELVTLYEDVQDFLVAERAGEIVGCGALHVLWADLGEVRTLAVHPDHLQARIGRML